IRRGPELQLLIRPARAAVPCMNVTSHNRRRPLGIASLQRADDLDVVRGAAHQVTRLVGCKRTHHQRRLDEDRHQSCEPAITGMTLNESMKLTVEIADTIDETVH